MGEPSLIFLFTLTWTVILFIYKPTSLQTLLTGRTSTLSFVSPWRPSFSKMIDSMIGVHLNAHVMGDYTVSVSDNGSVMNVFRWI